MRNDCQVFFGLASLLTNAQILNRDSSEAADRYGSSSRKFP